MNEQICKNCFEPKSKHLDTALVKNYDCPVWTGEHGGRHFEPKAPMNEIKKEDKERIVREAIEAARN